MRERAAFAVNAIVGMLMAAILACGTSPTTPSSEDNAPQSPREAAAASTSQPVELHTPVSLQPPAPSVTSGRGG